MSAFKYILTALTVGFLSPNRIAEIPSRALFFEKKYFHVVTLKTTVSSFSQLLITLFFGTASLLFTLNYFSYIPNISTYLFLLLIAFILFVLIYFNLQHLVKLLNKISYFQKKQFFHPFLEFKRSELFYLLSFSFGRYIVFSFQFFFILLAFGIKFDSVYYLFFIPIYFLINSIIPTILLTEIGVRGSTALFLFGMISNMDIPIVFATTFLWIINVAFPALLGTFNLKKINFLRK